MSRIRSNREKGALALYAGKSEQEAMAAAGLVYSPSNGRRFRNSADVKRRLLEMYEADKPFVQLEAHRAMCERRIIAYSNIMDYCTIQQGKLTIKNPDVVPPDAWRAVSKIKPTKLGLEITLYDKNTALSAIQARVDPVPVRAGDDADVDVPSEQVARWDDAPQAGIRPN